MNNSLGLSTTTMSEFKHHVLRRSNSCKYMVVLDFISVTFSFALVLFEVLCPTYIRLRMPFSDMYSIRPRVPKSKTSKIGERNVLDLRNGTAGSSAVPFLSSHVFPPRRLQNNLDCSVENSLHILIRRIDKM
ncbi:hypothetical protein V6N13_058110 [Hibiscus sabdariffa]